MSFHEYVVAKELHRQDVPFYSLVMAAMWKADNINEAKLRLAWPDIWDEVFARYHAPGGILAQDGATAFVEGEPAESPLGPGELPDGY